MDHAFLDLERLTRQGEPAVLATVVRGRGPSYRKPGASAVITGGGRVYGAISGGCLEQDLIAIAGDVCATGVARLVSYDTGSDEDLIWGTGSGCGGMVDVLLAPVSPELLELIAHQVAMRRPAAVATVISGDRLGARLAWDREGRRAGTLGSPAADQAAYAAAGEMFEHSRARPRWMHTPDGQEIMVQAVWPPPVLLAIGAGDDAQPVVELARRVGFAVTVVDHRPGWLTAERFSQADARVLGDARSAPAELTADPDTYAVLLTHHFQRDLEWLSRLLAARTPYVGLLGATGRSRRLTDLILEQEPHLRAAALQKLHTPVGLDIGADGPDQIALSIVAQVLAVRAGRPGGTLNGTHAHLNA